MLFTTAENKLTQLQKGVKLETLAIGVGVNYLIHTDEYDIPTCENSFIILCYFHEVIKVAHLINHLTPIKYDTF